MEAALGGTKEDGGIKAAAAVEEDGATRAGWEEANTGVEEEDEDSIDRKERSPKCRVLFLSRFLLLKSMDDDGCHK